MYDDEFPIDEFSEFSSSDSISEDETFLDNESIEQVSIDENSVLIAQMKPVDYENFVKILEIVIKDRSGTIPVISVDRSIIRQDAMTYILEFDISDIIAEPLTMDIINPSLFVRKLKLLKNDNYVRIYDDAENEKFIVTNNEIYIDLMKRDDTVKSTIDGTYDFTESRTICTLNIDKSVRKIVKELSSGNENIQYIIKNNHLKLINISGVGKYIFKEYHNEKDIHKLNVDTADLALVSANFLPVECEEYKMNIVELKDGRYLTVADSVIGGNIKVRICEDCDVLSNGSSFIL